MSTTRRQFAGGAAASALLCAFSPRPGHAQGQETAKILVGFAPGGTIDLLGRRVAEKLQPAYARTAIVENRTGAGGQIAVQATKNAIADGATVLLTPASPLGLHPYTYRKLPYDPLNDLVAVSGGAQFDYAFAVGPLVPASVKTLPEFLAWCQANPAQANFGSAGTGSAAHFLGAALGKAANADLRHVAFRGSQPALIDLAGGQIAAVVGPTGEFMAQLQAGRCRLLATSGPRRGRYTPQTPALPEQGFADLAYTGWFGFYLPARTPPETVQRLHAGIAAALAAPEVVESLANAYMEPLQHTPVQMAALLRTETAYWGRLTKTVGFTPEG